MFGLWCFLKTLACPNQRLKTQDNGGLGLKDWGTDLLCCTSNDASNQLTIKEPFCPLIKTPSRLFGRADGFRSRPKQPSGRRLAWHD